MPSRLVLCFALVVLAVSGVRTSTWGAGSDGRVLARYLGSPLHVLYVALQPGYEDLSVVAYYSVGLGARVRVAFVTNGEAGEPDRGALYPHELAAMRRLEATATLERFNAESSFLNMPDVASASDSFVVRSFWNADTLQARCRSLIREFMPDLILIARDRETDDSLRINSVRSDVLAAVRACARESVEPWRVSRVALESAGPSAIAIPIERGVRSRSSTARSIADSLGSFYSTVSSQRLKWLRTMIPSFSVLIPERFTGKSLEGGLPAGLPAGVRSLESAIFSFKQKLIRIGDTRAQQAVLLRELRRLLDSVDRGIVRHPSRTSITRRVLLSWKSSLEKIRNELLGVSVTFSVADSVVTDRQVIELFVTDVQGRTSSGTTELFFPAVDQGWVLNEDVRNRVPLELGKEYRLLSPTSVEYNYPQAVYGLSRSTVRTPLYFFVIHRAEDRSRSFTWRGDLRMWYAPRFTTEVCTPIVRALDGEQVVVRLTNHSRDGVRDSVYVKDSLVTARGRLFRLPGKGTSHTDTLRLMWRDSTFSGDHIADLLIDGISTARFLARGFSVETDRTRRIGLVTTNANSPTATALRRLGYQCALLEPEKLAGLSTSDYDVILVDRRAVTSASSAAGVVADFAERGGHAVILAQNTDVLAGLPILTGVQAVSSFRLDERTPVHLDTMHVLLRRPNRISQEDFDGWIFRRGYHVLELSEGTSYDVPVRNGRTGHPLVITRLLGKGRVTYVDLALQPQWLNVHAGALRLLANIVAVK